MTDKKFHLRYKGGKKVDFATRKEWMEAYGQDFNLLIEAWEDPHAPPFFRGQPQRAYALNVPAKTQGLETREAHRKIRVNSRGV